MVALSSIIFIWSIFSVAYVQSIVRRAINGKRAAQEDFPYQVSLHRDGDPRCGGGIIASRYVLTAAHCVANHTGVLWHYIFNVVVGTTDLHNFTNEQLVMVEMIYIPRAYMLDTYDDDIAVLKLEKDLDLSRGLRALELPTDNQTYVGQVAKIAGYGWNWIHYMKHGGSDDILRYLNVTIISNAECRRQERLFTKHFHNPALDSNICGHALRQDARNPVGVCWGDSGSPLVIGNTVVGLVSRAASSSCNEKLVAARYTRVSSFLGFVNNVLKGVITSDMKTFNLTQTSKI